MDLTGSERFSIGRETQRRAILRPIINPGFARAGATGEGLLLREGSLTQELSTIADPGPNSSRFHRPIPMGKCLCCNTTVNVAATCLVILTGSGIAPEVFAAEDEIFRPLVCSRAGKFRCPQNRHVQKRVRGNGAAHVKFKLP